MKNICYFMLKAFPLSRFLHSCPDFLVMRKTGLTRRLRLVCMFMTSQPGQQVITIHILSNILRSKGNQTMKFGQSIECNTKNILLENHQNVVKKLISDAFIKNHHWTYLWINSLKCYKIYFYCMSKSSFIKTKGLTTWF